MQERSSRAATFDVLPPCSITERRKASCLFAALVLLEVALAAFLIMQHRMPITHDGFQIFTLQHYFLNNAALSGNVAQWMPFMTQGTVSTWFYTTQDGLLQNVLLKIVRFLPVRDLLPLIHASMLVDALVLTTGTWLLAGRFFKQSEVVCFVCLCALGPSVWVDQPIFNFRVYYAIPLILYLGHRFLDTGRWRFAFAAGNLLALQTAGNLPYLIPMTSFVCFAYFVCYLACEPSRAREAYGRIRSIWPGIATLLALAACFYVAHAIIAVGVDSIVNYAPGRNGDGTVTIESFLYYGGSLGWSKWLELLLGISPNLDFDLYIGMLAIPMVLIGALRFERSQRHFVIWTLILIGIVSASPLARALFYCWPGMKYFRHLGLLGSLVRFSLCFPAGSGLQTLFFREQSGEERHPILRHQRILLGLLASAMGALSATLGYFASSGETLRWVLLGMITDIEWEKAPIVDNPSLLTQRAIVSAIFALCATVVLVFCSVSATRRQRLPWVLPLVLLLVAVDVYAFKLTHVITRTRPLGDVADLTYVRAMPFVRHRAIRLSVQRNNPFRELAGFIRDEPGALYCSTLSFLMLDEAGSTFRVDNWLRPYDQLMKTLWGQPVNDPGPPHGQMSFGRLAFPIRRSADAKVAGITEDRVQFFSVAHAAGSLQAASDCISSPAFSGDVLIVDDVPPGTQTAAPLDFNSPPDLAANERLRLPYHVDHFEADDLVLSVQNSTGHPAWMMYADIWHQGWRATVDRRPTPVLVGDLGYKAVQVPPGKVRVELRFTLPHFAEMTWFYAINSAVWLLILVRLMILVLTGRAIGTGANASGIISNSSPHRSSDSCGAF